MKRLLEQRFSGAVFELTTLHSLLNKLLQIFQAIFFQNYRDILEFITTVRLIETFTTSNSACGSPKWATDKWCDDENNNVGCNWDGGACCNNNFINWDLYCKDCECLESGTDIQTQKEPSLDRVKPKIVISRVKSLVNLQNEFQVVCLPFCRPCVRLFL